MQFNFYKLIFLLVIVYSSLFVLFSLDIPILEHHSFRQTQTAIISWYIVGPFDLINTPLPIFGPPWLLNQELPIFQYLVKVIYFGIGLDTLQGLQNVGRSLSWVLSLLVLVPIYYLSKLYSIDREDFFIFSSLYLSAPLYVFFSTSFAIESTALLVSMIFLYFFNRYLIYRKTLALILFSFFLSLSLLVKVTTATPFLLLTLFIYITHIYKDEFDFRIFSRLAIASLIPIILLILWKGHADSIAVSSILTEDLSSSSNIMKEWIFGTIDDRININIYVKVFARILLYSSPGLLIIILVSLFFHYRKLIQVSSYIDKSTLLLISIILLIFITIFTFPKLHYIHDYYQYSIGIFAIFFISILLHKLKSNVKLFLVVLSISLNILAFFYHPISDSFYTKRFDYIGSDKQISFEKISSIIIENSETDDLIISSGFNGWSSELAFFTKRKFLINWPHAFDKRLSEYKRMGLASNIKLAIICNYSIPGMSNESISLGEIKNMERYFNLKKFYHYKDDVNVCDFYKVGK